MDFKAIESKWQNLWAKERVFCTDTTKGAAKPKFYALDMFPYPSGHGLHIGHLASYTPTDVIARFKRAQGFNVLHPMGYDAFGLPAEQYAIATGVHPRITTQKAQDNFKNQLQSFGFSFDWEREISTCDPSFYKWTQKIVKILFERDLLYQKEVPVNWCPAMRTVLANEEVVNGRSERGGHQVLRMPMQQWMLRITRYADRLLQGLDDLDWPEATKLAQRNWIGRSEGCTVQFKLHGAPSTNIEVFTTRPDTLFGATFVVLAPEHALANTLGTKETKPQVAAYLEQVQSKSEVERQAEDKKNRCLYWGLCN